LLENGYLLHQDNIKLLKFLLFSDNLFFIHGQAVEIQGIQQQDGIFKMKAIKIAA